MNTSSWTVGAKLEWLTTKNEKLNCFLYYFENSYPSSRSRFLMVAGDCLETKRNPGSGFHRKQEFAPWFNIWIGEIPSYINTWLVSYHVLLLGSKITIGMTLGGRKLGRMVMPVQLISLLSITVLYIGLLKAYLILRRMATDDYMRTLIRHPLYFVCGASLFCSYS